MSKFVVLDEADKNGLVTNHIENSSQRKKDHLELALRSRVSQEQIDQRFYYEPVLEAHPQGSFPVKRFLGKSIRTPIWVSSMTGGTQMAKTINHNLARVCRDFGMGMGLGSCRSILFGEEFLDDFNVRKIIGDDLPLFGNLGIAQIELLVSSGNLDLIRTLVDRLRLDGLIVHINPMQEWFQPEGDHIKERPLATIQRLLDVASYPVIVKEVGQGMGIESLKALLKLPLAAIDFGANGGTNFALLELLRSDDVWMEELGALARVGHSAEEMVEMINFLKEELKSEQLCHEIIISGGITNFLDGYYLLEKCQLNSVYGQASAFLKYAMGNYDQLHKFVETQVKGLSMAQTFLRVK
jgi:isopentenyl-diphosphate delta-isomerase